MINELKIKCFLCVADTLNFTEAGKRMYMSQQAVSKHISNLEEDLGFQLLYRTRNTVKLTSAGERVCAFFSEASSQLDILLSDIRLETYKTTTNIRIGYLNWIDFGPAPGKAMAQIRKKAPDLHLIGERHTPPRLFSLLESGALDIILLHERFITDKPGQHKLPLIETPMQIGVARDNELNSAPGDYRRFRSQPLLIDAFEGESDAAAVIRAKKEAEPYGFDSESVIVVPNRDSIYTSAELGTGIFFGSSMAHRPGNGGSLVYHDTDIMEMLYCVWREKTGFIEMFAQALQAEYQSGAEEFIRTRKWA